MVYEEVTREMKIEFIFDMYKSAHGFKPRHVNFAAMSDEELDAFADRTVAENKIAMEEEETREAAAIAKFEALIAGMMKDHSIDRETAIRWDMQNYDVDGDKEFYAYEHGLPYRYFEKQEA